MPPDFAPGGEAIVAATSVDGLISFYDLTGRRRGSVFSGGMGPDDREARRFGATHAILSVCAIPSGVNGGDATVAVGRGITGKVFLWDCVCDEDINVGSDGDDVTGRALRPSNSRPIESGPVFSIRYFPGPGVLAARKRSGVELWRLRRERAGEDALLEVVSTGKAHSGPGIGRLCALEERGLFAFGHTDNSSGVHSIRVFDVDARAVVADVQQATLPDVLCALPPARGALLAFMNQQAATGRVSAEGGDKAVGSILHVWGGPQKAEAAADAHATAAHATKISALCDLAAEGLVATGSTGSVILWRAESGECAHVLAGHVGAVDAIAPIPAAAAASGGAACLAAVGKDAVCCWDVRSGALLEGPQPAPARAAEIRALVGAEGGPPPTMAIERTLSSLAIVPGALPIFLDAEVIAVRREPRPRSAATRPFATVSVVMDYMYHALAVLPRPLDGHR